MFGFVYHDLINLHATCNAHLLNSWSTFEQYSVKWYSRQKSNYVRNTDTFFGTWRQHHSPIASAGRIQRFRKGLPLPTMPYLVLRMNPGHRHLPSAAVTSKKRYHLRLLWYFATSFSTEHPKDPRHPVKTRLGAFMFTEGKLEKWAERAVVTLACYMLTNVLASCVILKAAPVYLWDQRFVIRLMCFCRDYHCLNYRLTF